MDLYWVWLSQIKYVGPILQKALLAKFEYPKAIFEAAEKDLMEVPGMNRRAMQSILSSKSLKVSEKTLLEMERKNIGLLHYGCRLYPRHALDCPESPAVLFYKGNLRPIQESVAVVGARRCTPYGKQVAKEIGRELALWKIPLISGFAKGIDSYSQEECVENGGYTIGFLAGGVDVCYPREQRLLYEKIIEFGGAFISRYPPGSAPKPPHFLQRNALISAWSKEVVIVEAAEQSGALFTAQHAHKHDRQVFAVPHEIGKATGFGSNNLIAQGVAKPYLHIGSLGSVRKMVSESETAAISKEKSAGESIAPESSKEESPSSQSDILSHLTTTPKSISELSHHLNKKETDLLEDLLTLELQGQILIM
jgi:DNA processing protein